MQILDLDSLDSIEAVANIIRKDRRVSNDADRRSNNGSNPNSSYATWDRHMRIVSLFGKA